MKRQSGFTLIELIIVIVILGILAVTAAPQFFNFGSDARESTVRGMEGSVKAAADLVFSRAAIEGKERDPSTTVNIGSRETGQEVAIAHGYPTAAGLQNALNVNVNTEAAGEEPAVAGDWNFSSVGESDTSVTITPAGFTTESGACEVVYAQASGPGNRPTITTSVDGC